MRPAIALLLAACGAAPRSPAPDPSACDAAARDARSAWTLLAERLAPADPEGVTTPIDDAVAQLGAHVAAVHERAPVEIEGPAAMALSGAVMDAIDALGAAVPEPERARADDAAEALLTDRTAAGSVRAARAAVAALEAALAATDPERASAREAALGHEQLRRRAQSAGHGYEDSPRAGDRGAARAEALDAALPAEAERARAEAIEASRRAREACGFSRELAVPSP